MEKTSNFWSICILFILTVLATPMRAQPDFYTISGTVRSEDTGKRVAYVNVAYQKEHVSTVTNADGQFVLKTRQRPEKLTVSHVGYRARQVSLRDRLDNLEITLQPSVVMLSEIIVSSGDPREILKAAVAKISTNYSGHPELFRGFYRETTQKGRRYIYVAEAVIDMYKTAYTRAVSGDRVRIDKARRLISPRQADTLGAKVQGGPTLPIYVDVVKNLDYIFSEAEMINYDYVLETPTSIDDRPQLVIAMRPRLTVDYPLNYGKIYIDRSTLAFTRVELDLDMADKAKATRAMLVRKPLGVRFKPREMKVVADYTLDNGVSRLNYVHSSSVFSCEWKRKLFHSNYRVTAEMVVTNRYPEASTISGRSSFDNRSSLYDKVELFEDPGFWGSDNIIEPTENLLKAIDKLKKKLLKDMHD
ncbi:MAG: carboxypeptidase-like regulatory domain-containing protein [Prevotella sp.]|nr:carboxypeptidase-like regulatory domain-containing protein [Prevotella sp.]